MSGTPTTAGDYTFTIRATNPGGATDSASHTISVSGPTPPPPSGKKPNAPAIGDLLAGDGRVSVTVARGAGGGTPSSFEVTSSPGGKSCTVTSSTGGSCVVRGLSNGTLYTFTAVAINAKGTSDPSSRSQQAEPGPVKKPSAQPVPRRLKAGQFLLTQGGRKAPVTVDPGAGDKGVVVEGDDFAMDLDGLDAKGRPMNLGPDGVLVLASERDVLTNGRGFMPRSEVDLYVDPEVRAPRSGPARSLRADRGIYVGTLTVKADGTFSGTATLPDSITAGVHDLQAVGVSRANLLRVMTLGVLVTERPGAVRGLEVASTSPAGRATLGWRAPSGSKLAGIDGYRVAYRLAGTSGFVHYRTVADPGATVKGLSPGCGYVFRVTAVNAAGKGKPAFTETTVIPAGRAAVPGGDYACRVL